MKTVALVTLYYPCADVVAHIEQLSKQVSTVILLDNTPQESHKDLFSHIKKSVYHSFGENLGLSAAFNRALKECSVCRESDFIFFFDQDSCVTPHLIRTLVNDFLTLQKTYCVGLLGPLYFDKTRNRKAGITKRAKYVGSGCFQETEIITSSMITTYHILEYVGFWDESIFLDYADFELCWRMAKKGFGIFVTSNATLIHSLGSGWINANFLLKKCSMTYSTPLREYYQTREAVKLLGRRYIPFNWRRNFIFNLTIRILLYTLYLPEKVKRLKYFCLGIVHGVLGRNGELKISC